MAHLEIVKVEKKGDQTNDAQLKESAPNSMPDLCSMYEKNAQCLLFGDQLDI